MADDRTLPGPLKALEIEVLFGDNNKIIARGKARYTSPYANAIDLGEAWYQLGPEDLEADGTVSRDRLGYIVMDLMGPFGWTAMDIEREGQH